MQFTLEGGQQGQVGGMPMHGTQGEYPLYFAFNDETQFSYSHLPELGSRLLPDKSSACTNASTMQAGVFRTQADVMATSTGCVPRTGGALAQEALAHPAEQQALHSSVSSLLRTCLVASELPLWHQPKESAGLNILF